MYVYPSIGRDECPVQCSGSKALVNVKMIEIANQSVC